MQGHLDRHKVFLILTSGGMLLSNRNTSNIMPKKVFYLKARYKNMEVFKNLRVTEKRLLEEKNP